MHDSSTSGILRVYRDHTRDFEFYGGLVWKVEYVPEYSHADRWFTSLEEANDFANSQGGRLAVALAAPTGFRLITDQDDLGFDPMYTGPSFYDNKTRVGVSSSWNAAEKVSFQLELVPGRDLTRAQAEALHEILGDLLSQVPAV